MIPTPTPTPTRTNNPLLHHVLHVYLTPLLIKHRAGQPLIRDDLMASYRAAQKELPPPPIDPPPPSSSAPPPAAATTAAATASARRNVEWVTNELSNLHALELDAYRDAARVALHHTMQSYQLDLPPYLPYNQQNPSVDDRTNHNSDSSCYVQTCVTHLEQQRFQTLELSWDVEEDIWNDCCINVVRTKAEVAIAAAVAAAAAVRSNANEGTKDATMATVPPQPSQSQPSLFGTMEQAAPRSTSYMGGYRSGTNKRGGTVFQEPDKEMVPDGPPIDDAGEEEKGDDEQEEDSSPHQTKDKDPNTNHTTDAAAMPSVPAPAVVSVVSVVSVANVPPVAKQHPNKIQTAMGALKKKMNSKGKKNKLGKVPPASGKSTVRKKKTVAKATAGGHGGPPTTTAPTPPVTATANHGQQQQPPPGKGGGSRGGRGRGGSRRSIGT